MHRVLPIYHLRQVLRASVTTGLVSNLALSYAVLAAWTVAAWAGAAWVVGRRRVALPQASRPSSRAMRMRWTSEVPSPISRIFASR